MVLADHLGGQTGDGVEVLPQRLRARIRGLQTHKKKIQHAVPGSRVAINLSGVSKNELRRGNVVALPGMFHSTVLVDVRLDYLPDAPFPLKHNVRLKLFCGSAEVVARVRLLGVETLPPGESGWVQLELAEPLPLLRGDRFIVRTPSPSATVGGGMVIDPHPGRKHRRFRPGVIARLETLARGTPGEILLQEMERRGPRVVRELVAAQGEGTASLLEELLSDGQVVVLDGTVELRPGSLVAPRSWWTAVGDKVRRELSDFHRRYPLRAGMGREELRSALRLQPRVYNGLLALAVVDELLVDEGVTLRLPEHQVRFDERQQQAVDGLLEKGMRALIVDLRNNPGGLLSAAVDVSQKFLPRGSVIVSIKGRKARQQQGQARALEPREHAARRAGGQLLAQGGAGTGEGRQLFEDGGHGNSQVIRNQRSVLSRKAVSPPRHPFG